MQEKFNELYLENFVFDEKRLEDVKFAKYTLQVIEKLCIFINDYQEEFNVIDLQKDKSNYLYSFYLYVLDYFSIFHYGKIKSIKKSLKHIVTNMSFRLGSKHNLGIKYLVVPTIFECEETRKIYLDCIENATQSEIYFEKFLTCCSFAIQRYVARKSFNENIKVNGVANLYVNFMPNNGECVEILTNIFQDFNQYLIDAVTRYCMSDKLSLEIKKTQEELFVACEKKIQECKTKDNKIIQLEKEIEELKTKMQKQTQKIKTQEQEILDNYCNEKTMQLQNENLELLRKNSKLEKQLQDIKQKYENFKEQALTLDEETIVLEDIEECDVYKKYGFVVGENSSIQNKLLERFVNSIVLSSKVKTLDVDCVVFMTSCIGHSHYYKIKNMCDILNVPYIHCHFKNIDCVKNTISKISIA